MIDWLVSRNKDKQKQIYKLIPILLIIYLLAAITFHRSVASTHQDFDLFYAAAKHFREHHSLYSPLEVRFNEIDNTTNHYVYPPTVAFLVLPLTLLSLEAAAKVWSLMMILALLLSATIFLVEFGYRLADMPQVTVIFFETFQFFPTTWEFFLGNANSLMLLCMVVFITSFYKKRFVISGWALAFAIMIKPWALLAIILPIISRKHRMVVQVFMLCAILATLEFSVLGWSQFLEFIDNYKVLSRYGSHFLPSPSLLGLCTVLFEKTSWALPIFENSTIANALKIACLVGLASTMIWLFRITRDTPYLNCLFLVTFLLSLILALPISNFEYFILSLPCVWLLSMPPLKFEAKSSVWSRMLAMVLYLIAWHGTIEPHGKGYISMAALLWGIALFSTATATANLNKKPQELL